jgi:hypothetical protein
MPANPRVRANTTQGVTTDNPLLVGATSFNSAGLANLPAIATQHAIIVLDPLRVAGAPEIVVVTAHTGAATSATITRGAYGTSARQHLSGTAWVHSTISEDYIAIATSATRPSDPYRGQLIFETDTDKFVARSIADAWQEVVDLGAWDTWTPTLTQSGTVTKTVTRATYTRVGRLIVASFDLAVTASGTGGTAVLVGLPVTAAASGVMSGAMLIYDLSTTTRYHGGAELQSTTTLGLSSDGVNTGVWGVTPSVALASGDIIRGTVSYEAAA